MSARHAVTEGACKKPAKREALRTSQPGIAKPDPRAIAAAFGRVISEAIDHGGAYLDFEVIFDIAADVVHPDTPDAVSVVEDLAEALDSMLQSARSLA